MDDPTVESGMFEDLSEPVVGHIIRVSVTGSAFLMRAAPVVAKVGDVAVEGITVVPGGTGIVGFLTERPADGAKLELGYADTGLKETDVTYEAPPVA
jgi:hypothetical protein